MTNKKAGNEIDYSKVSKDLVKSVEDVIADSKQHKYSISKIYAAYNEAYGLNEKPQGCATCLQIRVRSLEKWLSGYNEQKDINKVDPQYIDPALPGYVPQAEGTVRYPMADGIPFDFLPNKGTLVEGKVTRADGTKIKAGTYLTSEGLQIVVQDGKASIKEVE